MAKRYTRINWQDKPSTATPVSAANLNKMDKGIDDCDNAIEQLNDNLADFRYIKISEGTVIPANSSGNITIPTNISGTYLLTLPTTNAIGWRYAGICWLHGVAASRNWLIEIENLNLTVSLTDNVLTITNDSPQYDFTTTLILVRIG